MNFRWNYQPPTSELKEEAEALSRKIGISPILCKLLIQRGLKSEAEVQQFFNPQLKELLDPLLMEDMDKAVDRINSAIENNERILVYGDYDADGTTAVALVYNFLRRRYTNLDYYIPDRYNEGYGVSYQGVDYAFNTGVKLVIVLDCGIKAIQEIQYAKDKGIDFIVCDHHVPDDELPPAVAILNAKREDSTYPFKHLSGCGVGFKLMHAFALSNEIPFTELIPSLDLVAISTASDIVPIMGENRVLTYYGLQQLNSNPSIGLRAIIQVCKLGDKTLTINDIVFKIGPRLNAAGRMSSGKKAVDLLVEQDYNRALELAAKIDQENDDRKKDDKEMTEEANEIVKALEQEGQHQNAIILYNENWKRGVIGIVASRLTEIFYRPAIVLTKTGNLATGSARSVSGFDVYKAIESCKDLLENFGGHTYAAGLSLKIENVPEFKRRLEEYVAGHIEPDQIEASIDIDAEIDFKDITPKFFRDLRKFQPFGPDNQKPVFCTRNVYDYGTSKVVGRGQEHIKLELIDSKSGHPLNGIAFGQSKHLNYIKTKRSFNICYYIEENNFRRGDVLLQIESIKPNLPL
ncbi:MAG: single-stranded-DNA-specific exonuclease RecJ [Bacteroidaceae bacterium]|nr:single-stranded-DNA-specific exonuclease RecJ [Bacteroidaceae bacterium]MBO5952191.1 single-stranded-DNA-specific exonuclease RecJ [Bacteroidaceae bacterium]MBQ5572706.1 single-stranded-DNA-specific exonuclease RecJ [Bacteroidaceae bacterium]MBR4302535.1 single-stranded-DNA-specific exonuclease RecJ [Bacteroidaceae bacterium]